MSNSEVALLAQNLKDYLLEEFIEKDHKWIFSSSMEFFEIVSTPTPLTSIPFKANSSAVKPNFQQIKPAPQQVLKATIEKRAEIKQHTPIIVEKFKDVEEKVTTKNFATVKATIREKFPQFEILESIPSDKEAKEIASQWKQPKKVLKRFALLVNTKTQQQKEFLDRFEQAIVKQGGQVLTINTVEQCLSSDILITHKELQQQLLHQTAIFLEPLDIYLQSPETKRTLWNAILTHLS